MAEALALMHVGDVDLYHRPVESVQRVKDGNGRVREGGWIDDNPAACVACFMDPVDQLILTVRLVIPDCKAMCLRSLRAKRLNVSHRVATIDFRLALAQQVQIGAVEDENRLGHGRFFRKSWAFLVPSVLGLVKSMRAKLQPVFFWQPAPICFGMTTLVWFKRDLRIHDHAPLFAAAAAGLVLPVYVVEPTYWAGADVSRRQYAAIASAVDELDDTLSALGAPLHLEVGEAVEVLSRLCRQHKVMAIHAHEETGNAMTFKRDIAVRRMARDLGVAFKEWQQHGVVRPLRDRNTWGRQHAAFMQAARVSAPTRLTAIEGAGGGAMPDALTLGLLPDGCEAVQRGTRAEGLALFQSFVAGRGATYRCAMSSPLEGETACSRLSVPLSTGALSMREVMQWSLTERYRLSRLTTEQRSVPVTALDSLIARLHWHCHFIQKLESEPEIEWRSQHPVHEARRQKTLPDDPVLEAWATGRTGFPFVDACMRSLIASGWLNFRMRAMVMAFASYHLNLDWQATGTRLARLFTDYEPGIHWSQVQMQAGQTGINTPRIYNPVKQGHDQDPDGVFTRRFVPELAALPTALLHQPWKADSDGLTRLGITLGRTYPQRIVDHEEAARAARARLTETRREPGFRGAANKVFQRHGSRKRSRDNDDPDKTRAINAAKAEKAGKQLGFEF
jgi:deoxyribodipyrimidine photo-lyase